LGEALLSVFKEIEDKLFADQSAFLTAHKAAAEQVAAAFANVAGAEATG
jgi:hypothetical protein